MLTELNARPNKGELTDTPRASGVTNAPTIAVVGLGYVGLPLAVEFGKRYRTIGFDLSAAKVAAYRAHVDPTGEVSSESLRDSTRLQVTCDAAALQEADFIVVAVPTPVDDAHNPDFGPLLSASAHVGKNLRRGATVVFESTVYPGDRKSTRLNSSHRCISYAVFCLKKK